MTDQITTEEPLVLPSQSGLKNLRIAERLEPTFHVSFGPVEYPPGRKKNLRNKMRDIRKLRSRCGERGLSLPADEADKMLEGDV